MEIWAEIAALWEHRQAKHTSLILRKHSGIAVSDRLADQENGDKTWGVLLNTKLSCLKTNLPRETKDWASCQHRAQGSSTRHC